MRIALKEPFCNCDIMHVCSRKLNVNCIPQCFNVCVNLHAASVAAYSDVFVLALGFESTPPPLFCGSSTRLLNIDICTVNADILQICVRTEIMEDAFQKP